MANPTGFIEVPRVWVPYRDVSERVHDYREVDVPLDIPAIQREAERCMDCGIPFCHAAGCPVFNRIPEYNELVYYGKWKEACELLHAADNFPEFTGRVCPAPCEPACCLAVIDDPVSCRHIEYHIVERGFAEGWVVPIKAPRRTGKRVAVIGSGPAGLAAAQQLARLGHEAVLFEKSDRIGGLLRYGIPDFKLEKHIIDRRLEQMTREGVRFEPNVAVGADVKGSYLLRSFDAICLAMGAGVPRALTVAGAELDGVHFAMDFLTQQNRRVAGDADSTFAEPPILATDKHVIVIGGGDTGSDCVGTSVRQGAKSVTQLEILPKPPEKSNPETPWPMWPRIVRESSSHLEGCQRRWAVSTKELRGENGQVRQLVGVEVDWTRGDKGWQMQERPGSEFTLPADLVVLAMGFVHVEHDGLVEQLELERDGRGNVVVSDWQTSRPGVFAAGDARRGASLVVHAIHEGREAAAAIHRYLG